MPALTLLSAVARATEVSLDVVPLTMPEIVIGDKSGFDGKYRTFKVYGLP